jgi:CubicO group peptidase (beta-lactamase class C family)
MTQLNKNALDRMDERMQELYSQEQLPGISAVVTYRQEPIWSNHHGFADLDARRTAVSGTVYHLASVTKIFTAVALMQLRDANRLQLQDPLAKYLPEVRDTGLSDLTLQQLVSHTAGLPPMPPLPALMQAMQAFPPRRETLEKMVFPSMAEVIASLPQVEFMFAPGTQVSYSNLGVTLLAEALARAAGQKYTDYVTNQILLPLGMAHSGFSEAIRGAAKTATCYLPFSEPPEAAPFATKLLNAFTPTGGLWSSCHDMSHFLSLLTGGNAAVLSPQSLREMVQVILPLQSPHNTEAATTDGVGIGWFLTSSQHRLLAEHAGADPSTAAYVGWLPDVDLAIFMATNTGKNPTAVAVTAKALLALVLASLEEAQ